MTTVSVIRTHLELRHRDELRPTRTPAEPVRLVQRSPIGPAEYRALYALVGERWFWRDRDAWRDEDLQSYLDLPAVHVWIADVGDTIAGYFELRESGAVVEIVYFGLAAAYIGRGLGGWLLTRAVEIAFDLGAARVVLNTCTLDGPHALPNYLARGFRIVRDESYEVERALS